MEAMQHKPSVDLAPLHVAPGSLINAWISTLIGTIVVLAATNAVLVCHAETVSVPAEVAWVAMIPHVRAVSEHRPASTYERIETTAALVESNVALERSATMEHALAAVDLEARKHRAPTH